MSSLEPGYASGDGRASASRPVLVGAGLVLLAAPLAAHEGAPIGPDDLWTAWEWDPGVVIPLAISAVLYWRGSHPRHGLQRWEVTCFWCGWWWLLLALCSPLHPLGEALFSAHMVQHEILMLVSAPLLVLGRPLVPFLWALPASWRKAAGSAGKTAAFEQTWHAITIPVVATFIQGFALWIWHAPRFYQATLNSEAIHAFQHLCFLGTALLFWWSILRGRDRKLNYGSGVICLFLTLMLSAALGAILTFSTQLLYPAYQDSTAAWGLTPLQDQTAAGLVMWVPAGLIYIAAAMILSAEYLKESDRRADLWASTLPAPPAREEPSAS